MGELLCGITTISPNHDPNPADGRESMTDIMYPNPHTGLGFPIPTTRVDPLLQSNRLSLPFPSEAAAALGEERGTHSEITEAAVAEAQKRIYLMASMMGIWDRHDDPPDDPPNAA